VYDKVGLSAVSHILLKCSINELSLEDIQVVQEVGTQIHQILKLLKTIVLSNIFSDIVIFKASICQFASISIVSTETIDGGVESIIKFTLF